MFAPSATAATTPYARQLGSYAGEPGGPLILGIGGIHGNEPAGTVALANVLRHLHVTRPPFFGKLVGWRGNLQALQRGARYVHRDLNRMWSPVRLAALQAQTLDEATTSETHEQEQLLAAIEAELAQPYSQAIFLDLHTTSSDGPPFALVSDTLINRNLALQLPAPLILGLEESIEGTLLNYINELGHAALGFEAGQHQAELSVRNHEAAIWATLVAAGCLAPVDVPHWPDLLQTLRESSRGLPPVFELRYRHAIRPADEFVMLPGFVNFQKVARGQLLAHDRYGAVHAPEAGYLFMPLYQAQGEDGFFLVREVKPFWLKLAQGLRKLHFDRSLPFWPGVQRWPEDADSLVIDTQVARWFVLEICHLLGFRKHSEHDGKLIVTRRRQHALKAVHASAH